MPTTTLATIKRPWNKGLTKEVDPRVSSDKLRAHLDQVHKSQIGVQRLEETRMRMRKPKSPTHRHAISQARIGMRFSEEHVANMRRVRLGGKRPKDWSLSADARRRIAEGRAAWLSQQGFPWPETPLETALYKLLACARIECMAQKQMGRYVVDAYDPENGIVWEADSTYWHRDHERETVRDQYLLNYGVAAVIHLGEDDLRKWM